MTPRTKTVLLWTLGISVYLLCLAGVWIWMSPGAAVGAVLAPVFALAGVWGYGGRR